MNTVSREHITISKYVFPILILAVLSILFHNIFETYAYADVYVFCQNSRLEYFIDEFHKGGRPLYGLFNKLLFTSFNIEEVKYIRFTGLSGTGLLAVSLFYFFINSGLNKLNSLLIVLLFISSPYIGIVTSWAATYQVPWAFLLAVIAGYFALQAIEKRSFVLVLLVVILSLVSLLLYQPAYTGFIVPVFVQWLLKRINKGSVIYTIALHGFCYLLYFIIFKLFIYFIKIPPLERSGIDYDFLNNIWWVFNKPLLKSFEFSLIFFPLGAQKVAVIAISVLVLATLYITFIKHEKASPKYTEAFFILGFIILAMLPNFLSTDKWLSFRTMGTLYLIVSILIVYGLHYIPNKPIRYSVLGLLTLFSVSVAYYNVNNGQIKIQVKEYALMDTIISELPANTKTVQVISPREHFLEFEGLVPRVVTDEFGKLTTSIGWASEPFFLLLLKKHQKNDINLIIDPDTLSNEPGTFLIDIEKEYLAAYKN